MAPCFHIRFEKINKFGARSYVGGFRTATGMHEMLLTGADKVGVNKAAVKTPQVIDETANAFGCQCLVAATDAKRNAHGSWTVCTWRP